MQRLFRNTGGCAPPVVAGVIRSSFHVQRLGAAAQPGRGGAGLVAMPQRLGSRRFFLDSFRGRGKSANRIELNETLYDTTQAHYQGTIFGLKTDTIVYYAKFYGGLLLIVATVYLFFKGYVWLAEFSLVTVGKMGFTAGFVSCALLYSLGLGLMRRYRISPNAVYNQAIALVLRNEETIKFLGAHPKTGEFRAYHSSGGFKLPLVRRVRSGAYELSDLLGTKPRRLQMMFVLRSPEGKEGLVSCDVRTASAGIHATHYFHSLAVHLSAGTTGDKTPSKSVVIIGKDEDVVFKGLMKF